MPPYRANHDAKQYPKGEGEVPTIAPAIQQASAAVSAPVRISHGE